MRSWTVAAVLLVAATTLAGCSKHETYTVNGALGEDPSMGRLRDLHRDLGHLDLTGTQVSRGTGGWGYSATFASQEGCTEAQHILQNLTYVGTVGDCHHGVSYTFP